LRAAAAVCLAFLAAGCHDFDALSSQWGAVPDGPVGLDFGPTADLGAPDLPGGSCVDGVRDGDESDIDCGGAACDKCAVGQACVVGGDCQTATCGANGRCVLPAASCRDGVKDGTETDVDCGGACPRCVLGQVCGANADCVGGVCRAGRCAPGTGLTLSFNVPASVATGAHADALAAGDLNRDGRLDVAVLNGAAGEVVVLLNGGQGNFTPVKLPAGTGADGLALGDVDGDGNLDVIVLHTSAGQMIGLHRGNGDGTFAALTTFGDVNVGSVLMVDVNGDGRTDEVYTVTGGAAVNVALGGAGGAIGAPTPYATGAGTGGVVSADFNGDGYSDLAAVNGGDRTVSVLLNKPAAPGTFAAAVTTAALGSPPSGLTVGNFDAESKPDLAFIAGGNVFMMANAGTGTFGTPSMVAAFSSVLGIAAGDMDLDGKLDLVYVGPAGLVGVAPGNGNLTFRAPVEYAGGAFPSLPLIGDFTGDSRLDVAVPFANTTVATAGVNLLAQAADGSLRAGVAYNLGRETIWGAGGDFNADGKADLVLADHGGATAGTLNLALGRAGAALSAPSPFSAGARPAGVAVADIDGNGTLDVAVGSEGQNATAGAVNLFTGAGNGGLAFKSSFPTGNNSRFVAFADVNRDGKPDLLVAVTGVPGAADNGRVEVLLGDGKGGFTSSATLTPGANPRTLAVGDFNGDGNPDVAAANVGSNDVGVLLGAGDGTFGAATAFPTGLGGAFALVAADLNGDGQLDLAVTGQTSNNLALLMAAGGGVFAAPVLFAAPAAPRALATADFNLDGVPDLVVAGNTGGVGVFVGNGFGALQPFVTFPAGTALYAPVVEDFNGDGKPDLAMIGGTRTTVVLNTSH
jgi:hypothetical protein